MGQLLLVRHGQASWDADDYDVLSALGWEQSRLLGESLGSRLQPDVLVRGGLRRHRETAEAVVEGAGWSGVEVSVDPGWDEFDHRAMLDRVPPPCGHRRPSKAEFQAWFVEATSRWAGGRHDEDYEETFADFVTRVSAALHRAADRVGPDRTGVVFTSGGPVAWATTCLLLGGAVGETPEDCAALVGTWSQLNRVVVNSSVTKTIVGRSGVTLVTFNEHSHLEGEGLTYR